MKNSFLAVNETMGADLTYRDRWSRLLEAENDRNNYVAVGIRDFSLSFDLSTAAEVLLGVNF